MGWPGNLWEGSHGIASGGPLGEPRLTLDLCLVHDEVTGSPAALKFLRAALLGTELLVLPLVEGESRGGEPAVAGGAREGCQRVLLEGEMRRNKVAKSPDCLDSQYRAGVPNVPISSALPSPRVPKLHFDKFAPFAYLPCYHFFPA